MTPDAPQVPTRRVLALAVAALGVLAAEPLYLLVDTAVVGRLGAVALAALAVGGVVFVQVSTGLPGSAVANVVATCGVSLEHAVEAASANPARLLGLDDRGAIEAGRRADVVALDPETLRTTATWIGGDQVHG